MRETSMFKRASLLALTVASALAGNAEALAPVGGPTISRLTPPSNPANPSAVTLARFAPGQKFDLQATVQPVAGTTVSNVAFQVDGATVATLVNDNSANNQYAGATGLVKTGLVSGLNGNSVVASLRGYSNAAPGTHALTVVATDSAGGTTSRSGQFEVVAITSQGKKVKNIIIMLGDGMGAGHRTAARIMARGYAQGKAQGMLAMDTFPYTGMVMTASLNSIVTDSAPGMANYVNGNKANNNQEGVFPDDTADPFDNPRIEYLSEYLHRTKGTSLGIVTTADVFDATPAANAVHTSDRGKGTGINDQYLDDRGLTGLSVLLGGGRKWYIPNNASQSTGADSGTHTFNETPGNGFGSTANGSSRSSSAGADYVLSTDIQAGWGAAPGAIDPNRDLIQDFINAGYSYAPDKSTLSSYGSGPDKLLGLFSLSNMNIAMDKIAKRRSASFCNPASSCPSNNVDDYGFPDQPMLDEMTDAALKVLSKNPNGFILMAEAASIDKQAHLMDSDRWMLDTLEFDRAIQKAKDFAAQNPDTLVIVTADHECAGASIIGASTATASTLQNIASSGPHTTAGQRDTVVGTYEAAKFPAYTIAADGYPTTTDIDGKMLIGYGANADRYENWLTNPKPTQDSQQPFNNVAPLNGYPANPSIRNNTTGFLVVGQVPGQQAVHTGTDIPLSAFGRGASRFTGVFDNTDVFFKLTQAVYGGTP